MEDAATIVPERKSLNEQRRKLVSHVAHDYIFRSARYEPNLERFCNNAWE